VTAQNSNHYSKNSLLSLFSRTKGAYPVLLFLLLFTTHCPPYNLPPNPPSEPLPSTTPTPISLAFLTGEACSQKEDLFREGIALYPFIGDVLSGLFSFCLLKEGEIERGVIFAKEIFHYTPRNPYWESYGTWISMAFSLPPTLPPFPPPNPLMIPLLSVWKKWLEKENPLLLPLLYKEYPFPDLFPGEEYPLSLTDTIHLILRLNTIGYPQLAVEKLKNSKELLHSSIEPEVGLKIVKILLRTRNFSLLRKFAEKITQPPFYGEGQIFVAISYIREGKEEKAIEILKKSVEENKGEKEYALYLLGTLLLERDDLPSSLWYFSSLSTGSSSFSYPARFWEGAIHLIMGNPTRGVEIWEQFPEKTPYEEKIRFLYFLSRYHPSEEKRVFFGKELLSQAPLSFYGFLLKNLSPSITYTTFSFPSLPPHSYPSSLWIERGDTLKNTGLLEYAFWEWETAFLKNPDPYTLILIGIRYIDEEMYGPFFRLLSRFPLEPFRPREDLYQEIGELFYPKGYEEFVSSCEREYSLPPSLIFALIREESRFQKTARSPRGAMGLMQILPETAIQIQKERKEKFSLEELYNPERNIQMGCYYLSTLLSRWNGNLIYATASYNAGPEIVKKWVEKDLPLDLWIERIPYRETRNYVKKVLESYGRYEFLYKDVPYPPFFYLKKESSR